MNTRGSPKHVVIVGGGFAGLACARKLAKSDDVQITLIDKNNYSQFLPLLYQLATCQLGTDDVAASLRQSLVRHTNAEVKRSEVAAVDPKTRTVTTRDGKSYQGDFLVLAAGSQANFFGTAGAQENAFPLYSVEEAQRLRSRILTVFEDADRDPKLLEQGALNFVVIGGGPTGTEISGALADMIHHTMTREYTDLAVNRAQVYLIDHGHALLAAFPADAHDYAARALQRKGVQLKLGTAVKEVAPDRVLLSDGTSIPTRTVIWAGGLMASPLSASSGLQRGHGGRIEARPDLTVEGFPGVYVLGDFANIPSSDNEALPQLGSVAQQSGVWAAKNILAEIAGEARTPFHYHDKGIMAMIGRNSAVAAIGKKRHELDGPIAFAAWIGVHALLMSGVRARIEAFVDWAWSYFGRSGPIQVLDRSDETRIDWGQNKEDQGKEDQGKESERTKISPAA
jgi:NADH:ubiquinone reductase (H+-translocating)